MLAPHEVTDGQGKDSMTSTKAVRRSQAALLRRARIVAVVIAVLGATIPL